MRPCRINPAALPLDLTPHYSVREDAAPARGYAHTLIQYLVLNGEVLHICDASIVDYLDKKYTTFPKLAPSASSGRKKVCLLCDIKIFLDNGCRSGFHLKVETRS